MSKETGIFMFRFDDDEPHPVSSIFDYQEVSLTLKQNDNELGVFLSPGLSYPSITFTSKEGKKFEIFIKSV